MEYKQLSFIKTAFGAVELYDMQDESGEVVSKLSIHGAEFWLADESPENFNFSPETLKGGGNYTDCDDSKQS